MGYILYIGLLLILLGWIVQYFAKSRDIQKYFLLLYVVGVVLLVLDAVLTRHPLLALMNFGTGVMAFLILRNQRIHSRRR